MTVTINAPKTPVTKGSTGIAAATLPNICKMPGPPAPFVPTPLPNIGKSGDSPQDYSTSVTIDGQPVAIRGASFGSMGDVAAQGTGGGLISSSVQGRTKFIGPGSMNVTIEGKNVQLLGDPMLNNCGPGGSPANAATMAGVLQAPGAPTVSLEADLKQIAKECNEKVNKKAGYKPPKKPSGKVCTKLGSAKHACCEKAIKEANHPRVKSEVAFNKDGSLSAKSKGQALGAGSAARAKAKAAGMGKRGQKAAFQKAFFPNLPFAQIDVIIVKDPNLPPVGKNIERVIDFKFNCKEKAKMNKTQREKYQALTGKKVDLVHAR
jgi:uncharacterized Zn-binding protein involved in type VI secretion